MYKIGIDIESNEETNDKTKLLLEDIIKKYCDIKKSDINKNEYKFSGFVSSHDNESEKQMHRDLCQKVNNDYRLACFVHANLPKLKQINTKWLYLKKYDDSFTMKVKENEKVHYENYDGYDITIIKNNNCIGSSRNKDSFGTIVSFDKKKLLGDRYMELLNPRAKWKELAEEITVKLSKDFKDYSYRDTREIILPIYISYENNKPIFNMPSFSYFGEVICKRRNAYAELVGFIYITKAQARKFFNVKMITSTVRSNIQDYLWNEIIKYENYLNDTIHAIHVEKNGREIFKKESAFYDKEDCIDWAKREVNKVLICMGMGI